MMKLVEDASQLSSVATACRVLATPRSWYYRQKAASGQEREKSSSRPAPRRTLGEAEKVEIRWVLNSERFADQSPREVYAALLDEGVYLCHWRTMYRVLAEQQQVRERRNQLRHPAYSKPELLTTAPNQLWSWDITKLKGPVTWQLFYLYVVLDVFSRYVVGWLIDEHESGELARELIAQSYQKQDVALTQLTLHADRGPAMVSQTLAQLLSKLGVAKSHARPYTPDDNPFSEAQFKTMKYRPDYPERFDSLEHARSWARTFFAWYNHEHHHTSLGLMTPAMVHYQRVDEVRASRQRVLDAAYAARPERFTKGRPLAPQAPDQVWINPPPSVGEAPEPSLPDCSNSLAERLPVAEKMSTVGLNGHEIGAHTPLDESRSPAAEQKCSLFPVNELSQSA